MASDPELSDNAFTRDQVTPVDFKIRREQHELVVTWKDAHVSRYSTVALRKACPCATCNAKRRERQESTTLLPILQHDPGVGPPTLIGAELIGTYAIQFTWSDGHSTGIFDFPFLRSLDSNQTPGSTP